MKEIGNKSAQPEAKTTYELCNLAVPYYFCACFLIYKMGENNACLYGGCKDSVNETRFFKSSLKHSAIMCVYSHEYTKEPQRGF